MIWDLSPPIVLVGMPLAPPAIGHTQQWYSYVVLPQGATHFSYHLDILLARVLGEKFNEP